jgi:rhodanese-related sulfurtransferase
VRWAAARFWRPFNPLAALDFRPARGDFGARLAGHIGVLAAGCQEDMLADHQVHDLTPEDVSKGIAEGRYLLVDVREPNEVAVEAYPDGVVVPLQSFDPAAIPDPKGKQVVFACRSGKRSVTASLAAQAAGLPYDKHLAGGIIGWKAAGLPTRTGG